VKVTTTDHRDIVVGPVEDALRLATWLRKRAEQARGKEPPRAG
jgi:hypothetical protein